jgi:hypothetical protein
MKEEILRVIRIFGIGGKGILPYALANVMHMDKSNIISYVDELENENKIKRENQQAPYFPTDEDYKDPLLNARLFGDSFGQLIKKNIRFETGLVKKKLIDFVKKDQPYILNGKAIGSHEEGEIKIDTEFRQYEEQHDFTKYEKCYIPNSLESNIANFSDTVGSFVSRTLIEALSQDNYSNSVTDSIEQQIAAQEYVNKAISGLTSSVIPAFKGLIESKTPTLIDEFYEDEEVIFYGWECLECFSVIDNPDRNKRTEFIRDHQSKTGHTKGKSYDSTTITRSRKKHNDKFLFDNSISQKLKLALNNVFTAQNYEFDKIFQNMPNDKQSYMRFTHKILTELQNKTKKQQSCDHKFKKPMTLALYGFYGMQCSECNKIVRVKTKRANERK